MRTKKSLITWTTTSILVVIISIFSMTACSSDEGQVMEQTSEYDILLSQLDDYSSYFTASHSSQSRKDWGWKKFKKSIKADHSGYSNGSTVISISASRKKWKEEKLNENLEKLGYSISSSKREDIEHQVDSLKRTYISNPLNVGAIHNASILQSLLDDDMDFNDNVSLIESTIRSFNHLGFDLNVLNPDIKTLTEELDDFFLYIYKDDINETYSVLTDRYSERSNEFKVLNKYMSYIENLNSLEDVIKFTEDYGDIIKNSKVSNEEKNRMIENISIAPASLQLWMQIDELSK